LRHLYLRVLCTLEHALLCTGNSHVNVIFLEIRRLEGYMDEIEFLSFIERLRF